MKKRGENEDIMSSRGASYDGVALGLGKITWIIHMQHGFQGYLKDLRGFSDLKL